MTTRWTVRNVKPEAIHTVQTLADRTGTSLGEALSVVVRHGSNAALRELKMQCADDLDLVEALQRIQALQSRFARYLESLDLMLSATLRADK